MSDDTLDPLIDPPEPEDDDLLDPKAVAVDPLLVDDELVDEEVVSIHDLEDAEDEDDEFADKDEE